MNYLRNQNTYKKENNYFNSSALRREGETKIAVRQVLYTVPFLFLSGVFAGVAIMLVR